MKTVKKRRTPIVLFDLDGTLINTKRLYMVAYRAAVLPYIGRDLTIDEIMALRPRCEIRFLRDVVGPDRVGACLADFHEAYAKLHPEHFGGVYPGVHELLTTLRKEELPLGIVTGKSRRSWEITIEHSPLGEFDTLVFADDVAEPKPDPEGLKIALEALSADPEETYYLGDTVSDMKAALAAGVRPAGALWAKGPDSQERFARELENLGVPTFTTPADFASTVLDRVISL